MLRIIPTSDLPAIAVAFRCGDDIVVMIDRRAQCVERLNDAVAYAVGTLLDIASEVTSGARA